MERDGKDMCPIHFEVNRRLNILEQIQQSRQCQASFQRIQSNEKDINRIEKETDEQWTAINQLRKIVYIGAGAAGVLSLLGSLLGSLIRAHFHAP